MRLSFWRVFLFPPGLGLRASGLGSSVYFGAVGFRASPRFRGGGFELRFQDVGKTLRGFRD